MQLSRHSTLFAISLALGVATTLTLAFKAYSPESPAVDVDLRRAKYAPRSPELLASERTEHGHPPEAAVEIANLSSRSTFRIDPEVWPDVAMDLDELWGSRAVDNNSWEYLLHSLHMLHDLAIAHQQTGDQRHLERGWEIIRSWQTNNGNGDLTSRFAWNDHSSANRVIAICAFADYCHSVNALSDHQSALLLEILDVHGAFLADDVNYTHRHNHGIFQDWALIVAASHIAPAESAQPWMDLAERRLQEQVEIQFTGGGIHRENSPGYHLGVTALVRRALDYLGALDRPLLVDVARRIQRAEAESAAFIMPNGDVVPVGDTPRNQAAESIKPASVQACSVYPEVGYGVIREKLYVFFQCSNQSFTHKHCDDLSIVVCDETGPILTDVGFLNYERNDPEREYSTSWRAHNTVAFESQGQTKPSLNSGLVGFGDDGRFVCMVGKSARIEGVTHWRYLLYDRAANSLLIYDKCQADRRLQGDGWLRYHHFEPDHSITTLEGRSRYSVCRDHACYDLALAHGDLASALIVGQKDPVQGFVANAREKLEPAPSIMEKVAENNATFASYLSAAGVDAEVSIQEEGEVEVNSLQGALHVVFSKDSVIVREADERIRLDLQRWDVPTGYERIPIQASRRLRVYLIIANTIGWVLVMILILCAIRRMVFAILLLSISTIVDVTAIGWVWNHL